MDKYRFKENYGLEFGVYSLGDHMPNPNSNTRISARERILEIIELAKEAEQAGIDFFSMGESHQEYFVSQAHSVILSAIAQATSTLKIGSSATIISTSDPIRVYEDFATIDLISNGRMEIIAGRASRTGLYKLLGYDLKDYDDLFEEKFDLLLQINEHEEVTWSGKYRAPLDKAKVIPRPLTGWMPIWRAVGGPPASAIKAGAAGVPMHLAALGGPATIFQRTIEAYREAAKNHGHDPSKLPIAVGGFFHVAESTQKAFANAYPHINAGLELANGYGFPKRQFAQGADKRDVMNIGSAQQIIEKILYQHELYGNQRYTAQLDFGGVPFDMQMKNIEIIGKEILPAIRKYTKKE